MKSVLVVDSDVFLRDALKILIEQNMDYKVEASFSKGQDAVDYCKVHTSDYIFTDIRLSDMDGFQLAEKVRDFLSDIKICIISSSHSQGILKKAIQYGILALLEKPLKSEDIASILSQNDGYTDDYSMIIKYLSEIIDSHDYSRVYRECSNVAGMVMGVSGRKNEKTAQILRVILTRLLSRYIENPFVDSSLTDRFTINVNFLDDEIMVEMWLCNFLDFIYKHRFIERFSSVRSVFEYIDAHIKEYINMLEIVEQCHISQQYLLKLFKNQMKMSALEYIQSRKMLLAKWYLYFEEYSTMDVASKLGYGDAGYFSKVFKRYEKITPHQYRTNMRQKETKSKGKAV
ncbi:MAG: DNA-binding response regulator [Lachnospiraceae bacterium]|nr:DNA-binding response regulator [Lachnospiraceae bacterium]